jgi:hypothetical protein
MNPLNGQVTVDKSALLDSGDDRRAVGNLTSTEAADVFLSDLQERSKGGPVTRRGALVTELSPARPWWLTSTYTVPIPAVVALVALIWFGGLDVLDRGLGWKSFAKPLRTWVRLHLNKFEIAPRKKNRALAWTSPEDSVTKDLVALFASAKFDKGKERYIYYFRWTPAAGSYIAELPAPTIVDEGEIFSASCEIASQLARCVALRGE